MNPLKSLQGKLSSRKSDNAPEKRAQLKMMEEMVPFILDGG